MKSNIVRFCLASVLPLSFSAGVLVHQWWQSSLIKPDVTKPTVVALPNDSRASCAAPRQVLTHIDDPNAVRKSTSDPEGKLSLQLLRDAIAILENVDAIDQSVLRLDGYDAIRAVHGVRSTELLYGKILGTDFEGDVNRCVHVHTKPIDYQPLFLLWHRAYVRAFEITVRSVLRREGYPQSVWQSFGIPYWDWSVEKELPCEFRSPEYVEKNCPGYRIASRDDVDGRVQSLLGFHDHTVNALFDTMRNSISNAGGQISFPEKDPNPFNPLVRDFKSFSEILSQGWHDRIHGNIGYNGADDMGISDVSVRDPVFWVHHSNIDRLLMAWINELSEKRESPEVDEKKLEEDWTKGAYRFPVLYEDHLVWYQPSFKELNVLSRNFAMGYRYSEPFPVNHFKEATSLVAPTAQFLEKIAQKSTMSKMAEMPTLKASLEGQLGARRLTFRLRADTEILIDKRGLIINVDLTLPDWQIARLRAVSNSARVLTQAADNRPFDVVSLAFGGAEIRSEENAHKEPYQVFFGLAKEAEKLDFFKFYAGTISLFTTDHDAGSSHERRNMQYIDITDKVARLFVGARARINDIQKKRSFQLVILPVGAGDSGSVMDRPIAALKLQSISLIFAKSGDSLSESVNH